MKKKRTRKIEADTRQLSIFDTCSACAGTGDLCQGKKMIKIECIFCDGRGYGQREFKPSRRRRRPETTTREIMQDGHNYYASQVAVDELYNPYNDYNQFQSRF